MLLLLLLLPRLSELQLYLLTCLLACTIQISLESSSNFSRLFFSFYFADLIDYLDIYIHTIPSTITWVIHHIIESTLGVQHINGTYQPCSTDNRLTSTPLHSTPPLSGLGY
ncbi:hypothetical protein BKA61DRAFT_293461 [Leptodontidium sp. MPI-SDFR-AT-0119]|nr:hypothetical protein BKA61DRAFT_293461 [Leptodontidium sp. MPI-SDFR-AT-0119]